MRGSGNPTYDSTEVVNAVRRNSARRRLLARIKHEGVRLYTKRGGGALPVGLVLVVLLVLTD
jgi:hypothetical protein